MSNTRLFIGDLSADVQEKDLRQKFSSYGNIVSLVIKEKKDLLTDEVIKRFAFATLEGPSSSIDQCIHQLNGTTLNGATISVERAQESFIERLKREREAKAQGKTPAASIPPPKPFHHSDYKFNTGSAYDGGHTQNSNHNFAHSGNDYDSYNNNSQLDDYSNKRQLHDQTEEDGALETKKRLKHTKDGVVPSLQSYSAVWRDADSEGEEPTTTSQEKFNKDESRVLEETPAGKKGKSLARYDPTRATAAARTSQQQQTTVKSVGPTVVAPGLAFTGASSSFSLLSMLQQQSQPGGQDEAGQQSVGKADQAPSSSLPSLDPMQTATTAAAAAAPWKQAEFAPYKKTANFFADSDPAEVEGNLRWINHLISREQQSKFQRDRQEIVKLYMDRLRKAQADRRPQQNSWEHHNDDLLLGDPTETEASLYSDTILGLAPLTVTATAGVGDYGGRDMRGRGGVRGQRGGRKGQRGGKNNRGGRGRGRGVDVQAR